MNSLSVRAVRVADNAVLLDQCMAIGAFRRAALNWRRVGIVVAAVVISHCWSSLMSSLFADAVRLNRPSITDASSASCVRRIGPGGGCGVGEAAASVSEEEELLHDPLRHATAGRLVHARATAGEAGIGSLCGGVCTRHSLTAAGFACTSPAQGKYLPQGVEGVIEPWSLSPCDDMCPVLVMESPARWPD